MGLFGKKKEEAGKTVNCDISDVKILGGGCSRCNELERAAVAALEELGISTAVGHVTDFTEISAYGVMTTPALVVNGKVVSSGSVLKKNEIIKIIQEM